MRIAPQINAGLLVLASLVPACAGAANELARVQYQTYVDVAYAASNREPSDDRWPAKTTSTTLNEPTLNLAMANLWKEATTDSRWGFEFGLQAGEDSEGLVPSPPPEANKPNSNADELRHFYRANVSYLFGDGDLKLTGGLIDSYIGYESYLAIDNPNYTRAYLSDTVPFFLFGLEAMWDVNEAVDLGFYLINGYNYLSSPNDIPSTGFLGEFKLTQQTTFIQNFYYGSDQKNTDIEFWRFYSGSTLEWQSGAWLIAGSLSYGTEKQADLPDQPRHQWSTGVVWLQWQASERLSLAFRPEFHLDADGIATGGKRKLQAYTTTLKYEVDPRSQRLVGVLELRYDKARGEDGGFPDKPDDQLKNDQLLFIASVMWSFGG